MLDQGRQKRAQVQKGIYANRTDIHGEPNLELVRYSSGKREEKGKPRENGQGISMRTEIVQTAGGLSSFTRLCTSHLAPHQMTVNRLPPPPPPTPHPHPFSTSTHASSCIYV